MGAGERLDELLRDLNALDRLLDEYERTRDPAHMAEVQKELKRISPRIKAVVADPEAKSAENAPKFVQVSNLMKSVLSRTKILSGQSSAAGGGATLQRTRNQTDVASTRS
eukprot:CAMPEP_0119144886 /NCGR_PEP_ID=MMETSP1310-20130426/36681_1 /TAXON_ID=464262 /ORGANISM="Genus nov. species nov., Strain RCC2339" /LENGTH=109 /DNA_ID=CAMNT_0007136667 /DNA_START=30 /DNA_END=356 /DNA_ORIENTATION=+